MEATASKVPYMVAPGNHEVRNAYSCAFLFAFAISFFPQPFINHSTCLSLVITDLTMK